MGIRKCKDMVIGRGRNPEFLRQNLHTNKHTLFFNICSLSMCDHHVELTSYYGRQVLKVSTKVCRSRINNKMFNFTCYVLYGK